MTFLSLKIFFRKILITIYYGANLPRSKGRDKKASLVPSFLEIRIQVKEKCKPSDLCPWAQLWGDQMG